MFTSWRLGIYDHELVFTSAKVAERSGVAILHLKALKYVAEAIFAYKPAKSDLWIPLTVVDREPNNDHYTTFGGLNMTQV